MPLLVLLWALFPMSHGAEDGIALRLGPVTKGRVIATPYVVPEVELQVLAGAPKGYVYGCKQEVTERLLSDHIDDVVALSCAEGVRLELKGVHFK